VTELYNIIVTNKQKSIMKKILLSLLIISIVYFDVNAQKIWGSTLLGGADGIGLIYSYDYSSNTLTSEFEFSIYNKGDLLIVLA
jgi:hypothetical protein